jgi:hypothetical protein
MFEIKIYIKKTHCFFSCRILEDKTSPCDLAELYKCHISAAGGCVEKLRAVGFDESANGEYALSDELSEDGLPYYKQTGKNISLLFSLSSYTA